MSDKRVTDNTQAHRFEIFVEDKLAGYAEYRQEDGSVAFTHTVVEPQSRARVSAQHSPAARWTRSVRPAAQSLPYCAFIRSYTQGHPAYLDLVPGDRQSESALTAGDPTPDQP